jgi:teichuronic acid biosynthesis glycosyltransferase TuaC
MKLLIVTSVNSGSISPFVMEQGFSLQEKGIEIEYFLINGKGLVGYLANLPGLKRRISSYKPDLIHAHYGLSALLANLQRKVPVISTFHGSDIFISGKNRLFSQIAHLFSKHSIIVNKRMKDFLTFHNKISFIPCGVDYTIFSPIEKDIAIKKMGLTAGKINILFSSAFDNQVKNYHLAKEALYKLGDQYNLIELKGFSRPQVNLLLNGCDIALMTSFSEGSPQFIKEALACNCPIVSTDVGDVSELLENISGCFICENNPEDVADKINLALSFEGIRSRTNGRQKITDKELDSETVARKIIEVYRKVLGVRN